MASQQQSPADARLAELTQLYRMLHIGLGDLVEQTRLDTIHQQRLNICATDAEAVGALLGTLAHVHVAAYSLMRLLPPLLDGAAAAAIAADTTSAGGGGGGQDSSRAATPRTVDGARDGGGAGRVDGTAALLDESRTPSSSGTSPPPATRQLQQQSQRSASASHETGLGNGLSRRDLLFSPLPATAGGRSDSAAMGAAAPHDEAAAEREQHKVAAATASSHHARTPADSELGPSPDVLRMVTMLTKPARRASLSVAAAVEAPLASDASGVGQPQQSADGWAARIQNTAETIRRLQQRIDMEGPADASP